MTITKARERFGLNENDTIYADGIKALMESTKQRLNTWSLPNYVKADLEKDLKALEVLLTVAE